MTTKVFEIRDFATTIPVMSIKFTEPTEPQRYWLKSSGYVELGRYVFLFSLRDNKINTDPYNHEYKELEEAHRFIENNWDALEDGDVIDLRFIRGESSKPCKSERPFKTN